MNFFKCCSHIKKTRWKQPSKRLAVCPGGYDDNHYVNQFRKRMLLLVLLICFICIKLSTAASAQGITIAVNGAPITTVLSLIEKQTDYIFWYDKDQVRFARPVTLNLKNATLPRVLDACFKGQPFTYLIGEKSITVKAKLPGIRKQNLKIETDTLIRGKVEDEQGNPLPGVSVKVKGTSASAMTNTQGNFSILLRTDHFSDWVLVFSFIGYKTEEVKLTGKNEIIVVLKEGIRELQEVNVSVNTGYQALPKERATGSFSYVDNKLLNRSIGTNILNRLDGVTSGLIFNKQANHTGLLSKNGGDPGISVRGRSTIFANTEPLIVLDNFPYNGDLSNINPNDIESVTVLKDAAAASIWGVRAGNGVVVLTSKKGNFSSMPKVTSNSNLLISKRPDIYKVPQMSSKEYIELEKYWFDNGKYNAYLNIPSLRFNLQSPVIDILDREKKGLLGHEEAFAQLEALSNIDSRNSYSRYFLRNAVNKQYAVNISGGSTSNQYYISGGYDKNLENIVSNSFKRININANNRINLFEEHLTIDANLLFTRSERKQSPGLYNIGWPYERSVDENGRPLAVVSDYRQASKDALSNIGLLDWNYYPFNERLNDDNITSLSDYRLNIGVEYKIIPQILNLNLNYQYQRGNTVQSVNSSKDTYSTRLLINQFSYSDPSGNLVFPIPIGDIVRNTTEEYYNNTGRIQLNYNQDLSERHKLNGIIGSEVMGNNTWSFSNILYGYNKETATNILVDFYKKDFPQRLGSASDIPNVYGQSGSIDHYLSFFSNLSYTYNGKYTFSVSARKDESNLFGVDANRKGIPLYSTGFSWEISKEKFYGGSLFSFLKFRLSNGYNGNLSKNLSAHTTAKISYVNSDYNVPSLEIVNPPNPLLSWEKVHIINTGLDFGAKNGVVSGSIDFFYKRGENLIGNSPISPQTGMTLFTGNTANILTKGIDFIFNSNNLQGKLKWSTSFLAQVIRDKVTDYKLQTGTNSDYVNLNYKNPIVGKSYSAILSYRWAGLDSHGNPQGYLNGQVSRDYSGILNSTNNSELVYKGNTVPTFFGSLRNTLYYRKFELSANITFKFDYYFRRGSFNSINTNYKQSDYNDRWKSPGDEKKTDVPSLIYPNDVQRMNFYIGSEVLLEKGDHVRLQDVQLSYTFPDSGSCIFRTLRVYGYINNIGIIWRANKRRLDPDFSGNGSYYIPNPVSLAFGLTVDF